MPLRYDIHGWDRLKGPTAFQQNYGNWGGAIFSKAVDNDRDDDEPAYKTPVITFPDDTIFEDNYGEVGCSYRQCVNMLFALAIHDRLALRNHTRHSLNNIPCTKFAEKMRRYVRIIPGGSLYDVELSAKIPLAENRSHDLKDGEAGRPALNHRGNGIYDVPGRATVSYIGTKT